MIKYFWVVFLFIGTTVKAQLSDFKDINFRKADSIAYSYKGESLYNLPLLSYNLTNSLTSDVEKFRAIYTWVSTNIENDYWSYVKNKRKRRQFQNDSVALENWNTSFRKKVFQKLLKEKKTLCTGYAYLVRELANMSDIECEVIDGYGKTTTTNIDEQNSIPNHSWNAVKLNDKWYLSDATWSSGFFNIDKNEFISEYNDGYFLADPKLFVQNHYPLDTEWLCLDNKPSISDFLNAPLIYKHAFNYGLIPLNPSTMKLEATKDEVISFLFDISKSTTTENIELEINTGSTKYSQKPVIKRNKKGYLEIQYTFKRLGHYDVHLKINDQYLFTYVVSIKKDKT